MRNTQKFFVKEDQILTHSNTTSLLALYLFLVFQKAKKKTEIPSINNNSRFRIQVKYGRLCYYTACTNFRDEKAFAFTLNPNVSNSTKYQTAITTNLNFIRRTNLKFYNSNVL